jgi:flagellar hook-associated protein 3 FlgL
MRVNPNHTNAMLTALERVSAEETKALGQLSSGKRIERPSDDPAGMAALIDVQDASSKTSQYLSNISAVRSQAQGADSSLSSVVTALTRALSLGVSGANSTLNDSDRASVATELDGIGDQLLELANSSSQGVYFFGGTATTAPPFVKGPLGVTYQGNAESSDVVVGEGYVIRTNVPGSDIFGDDATGVFASLQQLATAVRTNTGVSAAVDALSHARDQVSAARVVFGNAMNQSDSEQLIMNDRKLQLAQQATDIAGADLAEVATRLSSTITTRNALLAAMSKVDAMNLFDYLK